MRLSTEIKNDINNTYTIRNASLVEKNYNCSMLNKYFKINKEDMSEINEFINKQTSQQKIIDLLEYVFDQFKKIDENTELILQLK
ncbi:hypothetical protein [Methanosphaera sp.]